MFTEQWEIVMSDIGDESEKQISYRTTRFCVDKMNEGKAGHVVQIFVYPWNYITIHVFLYRSMAKSFPCQIQKMKVETIHPFKVRSVRFVVVSESLQISFLVLSCPIFCTWCNYFLETVSFCLVFKITLLRCSLRPFRWWFVVIILM